MPKGNSFSRRKGEQVRDDHEMHHDGLGGRQRLVCCLGARALDCREGGITKSLILVASIFDDRT